MSLIAEGSYQARGVSMQAVKSQHKGTQGVTVTFVILDEGPAKNRMVEWTGWLSENTEARTAESLAICGYDGTNPETVKTNLVQLVIEHEPYTNPTTGKTYTNHKVRWVNDINRGRTQHAPMEGAERMSAMDRLKGLVLSEKQKLAQEAAKRQQQPAGADGSFEYGANAPAPQGPPPGATPGTGGVKF